MQNSFFKNRERLKKIIIILLLLLVGIILLRSCTMSSKEGSFPQKKKEQNKIVAILKMPFFYVLEYPKIIMGISEGTVDGSSAPSQPKEKQAIKF